MKTNKIQIKTRTVKTVIMALCICVFTSCLKDKAPGSENYSHSPALVGFQYRGGDPTPYVASILGTPEDTVGLEVTLSVASLTIKTPVTLTIVPYPAGLDSFSTAQGSDYEQLDPSLYTLQDGGNVTINPGQQIVSFRVNFAGDKIDFTKLNGIGLRITDVQGALLTSNLSTAIIAITLRSIYEGNYHAFGERKHPAFPDPFPFDYNVDMGTVDANTITGPAEADLQAQLTIHINPDFSVTLSSNDFPPFLQAGKENKYDPDTKTFTLNYYYNSGAPRLITETLVLN